MIKWHENNRGTQSYLDKNNKGFKVLRLWEFKINKMTLGEFRESLKNVK